MSEQLISTVTTLLSILAAGGSAVAWFFNRPTRRADALKTQSETLTILSERVTQLEKDRTSDHKKIMAQDTEILHLSHLLYVCLIGLETLTAQLTKANIVPEWMPSRELTAWMAHFSSSNGPQ